MNTYLNKTSTLLVFSFVAGIFTSFAMEKEKPIFRPSSKPSGIIPKQSPKQPMQQLHPNISWISITNNFDNVYMRIRENLDVFRPNPSKYSYDILGNNETFTLKKGQTVMLSNPMLSQFPINIRIWPAGNPYDYQPSA